MKNMAIPAERTMDCIYSLLPTQLSAHFQWVIGEGFYWKINHSSKSLSRETTHRPGYKCIFTDIDVDLFSTKIFKNHEMFCENYSDNFLEFAKTYRKFRPDFAQNFQKVHFWF